MEVVLSILLVLLAAFIVGGAARFAVPGPDPMPVWMTTVIGGGGAFLGFFVLGAVGALLGGTEGPAAQPAPGTPEEEIVLGALLTVFVVAVVGATIVLVLYRKLVQKRPITGPEAHRTPLRPRGLRRVVTRQPHRFFEETAEPGDEPAEQLRKLVLLRDAGKISAEEFEARKARLVEAI